MSSPACRRQGVFSLKILDSELRTEQFETVPYVELFSLRRDWFDQAAARFTHQAPDDV
jgi:hypothetical protein